MLTKGHSKDHRPDLKQFKIEAAVQEMKKYFSRQGYKDIIYVGDSYASLDELSGIKFISRFSENFKLVSEL